LPNSFGELDKLEEITLDKNNLHSLPPSIFQLPDLVTLSLKGNKKLRLPLQYRQRIEELNPPSSSTSHMTPQEINIMFSHSNASQSHLARGRTRKSRKFRKYRRRRSRRRK
jgi:Leucine-rich repeat (LRR) protein